MYSKVTTPRFYVDYIQYLSSMGIVANPFLMQETNQYNMSIDESLEDALNSGSTVGKNLSIPGKMNRIFCPNNYKTFYLRPGLYEDSHSNVNWATSGIITRRFSYPWQSSKTPQEGLTRFLDSSSYIALFGHNFASLGVQFRLRLKTYLPLGTPGASEYGDDNNDDGIYFAEWDGNQSNPRQGIYNGGPAVDTYWVPFNNDGTSIFTFQGFQNDGLYQPDGQGNYNEHSIYVIEFLFRSDPTLGMHNGGAANWTNYPGGIPPVLELSSISMGKYFDMPQSPDLNMTHTIEYETKRQVTKGGKVISKAKQKRRPSFNRMPEFNVDLSSVPASGTSFGIDYELDVYEPGLTRTGKKSWEINYSYLEDKHLMGYNESSTPYYNQASSNLNSGDPGITNNLNNSMFTPYVGNTDFYSKVIHLTQGRLPFIFQPDNTSFTTSDFYVCGFDQDSFSNKQIATGVYETSMSIKETW